MKIAHHTISSGTSPFIIAEMSGNHNQSLDKALEIVEAAARAGAHALKLQTYTADTITLDISEGEFFINDEQSLWKGAACTTSTTVPPRRGSGTHRSSRGHENSACSASPRRLMRQRSTFSKNWMCPPTKSPPLRMCTSH